MELGVTAWRVIINDNFSKIYSKGEVDGFISGGGTNFMVKDIDIKGLMKFNNTLPSTPLPSEPKGYIRVMVNGKAVKVPYYAE